jgi:hypothetical protein
MSECFDCNELRRLLSAERTKVAALEKALNEQSNRADQWRDLSMEVKDANIGLLAQADRMSLAITHAAGTLTAWAVAQGGSTPMAIVARDLRAALRGEEAK